ncbi:hypothetical protein FOZ62_024592 [Perkinsus olseni]|uniref:Uncharacterized protein n=1 Tax=Perkinsus olseni TaxID=32597 RepID=A0A7J6SZW0_PEROL|nr:hypothetical protein FOZ62_024592 [Perkinsus olseni]
MAMLPRESVIALTLLLAAHGQLLGRYGRVFAGHWMTLEVNEEKRFNFKFYCDGQIFEGSTYRLLPVNNLYVIDYLKSGDDRTHLFDKLKTTCKNVPFNEHTDLFAISFDSRTNLQTTVENASVTFWRLALPWRPGTYRHQATGVSIAMTASKETSHIKISLSCGEDDVRGELATSPGNSIHGFFAYAPDAAEINPYKDAVGKFCGTSLSPFDLTYFAFVTEKSVLSELYGEFITLTANAVSS